MVCPITEHTHFILGEKETKFQICKLLIAVAKLATYARQF